MVCPNENIIMKKVRVDSHYGTPVILEQCPRCGGIWFDESELYRIKQGEAEKAEIIDSELLRKRSPIQNNVLRCPNDQSALVRFQDNNFPEEIIIESCPKCHGFWVKKGGFIEYQKYRGDLDKSAVEDEKFDAMIEKVLARNRSDEALDALGRLGKFLSTPVDRVTMRPIGNSRMSEKENQTYGLILDIISIILNLFIRR